MKRVLIATALILVASASMAKTDAMSLVPNDAVTIGVVHINQIRTSALMSSLLENTDNVSSNGELGNSATSVILGGSGTTGTL